MEHKTWKARTRHELILEVWERLDCESVGKTELEQIQKELIETLGGGAVDSPASIARLLADEGAVLRHPEVLKFDTEWRIINLSNFDKLNFESLSDAVTSLRTLDSLRKELIAKNEQVNLARMHEFVSEVLDELALVKQSKSASSSARAEANEVIEWLRLWRQTPDLFLDWLELRLRSEAFRDLFPEFKGS